VRSFIATALYVLLTAASVACRPGDDTGRTGVKELHATGVPVDTPPSSLVADSGFLKDPLNVSAWGDFVAVSDAVTDSLLICFRARHASIPRRTGVAHGFRLLNVSDDA